MHSLSKKRIVCLLILVSWAFTGLTNCVNNDIEVKSSTNLERMIETALPSFDVPYTNGINETLLYSSYLGGSQPDTGYSIALDDDGNIYVAGITASPNFPTVNAYDSTHNGNYDAFIMKLSANGSTPIFSTFIGGSNADHAYSIDVDSDGYIYLSGYTFSTDFPVLNGYDSTHNGNADFFVTKLNPTGDSIVYSTFVGGSSGEYWSEMAVDSLGNVHLGGRTSSNDFPVNNAFQSIFGGSTDSCVFKLNSTGNGLIYSTYLGSPHDDEGTSIHIDESGNAYLTGTTRSALFPTLNAYDDTHNGNTDCFVAKFNGTGNLLFSTYIGSSGDDAAEDIGVDQQENIYVTGYTMSSGFPMVNAIDSTLGGSSDCFLLKLNSTGQSLDFSTYLGGSGNDYGHALIVDDVQGVYVAGETGSTNFPIELAYDEDHNGGSDGFYLKLNSSAIEFSTYIGGSDLDRIRGFVIDENGTAYLVGNTASNDFPIINGYDITPNGNDDSLICKICTPHDPDQDGLSTINELVIGTYPLISDSDLDLLSDGYEFITLSLDPLNNDTDFDLMPDGWEVFNNLNASYANADDDADMEGLTNLEEYIHGTDPWNEDSDFDTLNDAEEVNIYGTNPMSSDTDLDLMPDGWEVLVGLEASRANADEDPDLDNLSNIEEYGIGTHPLSIDSDSDLMPDGWEHNNGLNPLIDDADLDADSDTLTNLQEYQLNTNPQDSDSDSDLMPDAWEVLYGLNPLLDDANLDLDSDSLSNIDEFTHGTLPNNSDSDSDSMPDGWEVSNSLNPLLNDANLDPDLDNLNNLAEYIHGTSPNNADTDSDSLDDWDEINEYGTNPLSSDSDSDNLSDGDEVNTYGTNPLLADTDGDGIPDDEEISRGSDPLVDDGYTDSDNDGLSDAEEFQLGTNPSREDSDGDGLPDGWEVDRGLDPLSWTHDPGQRNEYLGSFLLLGGGGFFLLFMVIIMISLTRAKSSPVRFLRARSLLIPAAFLFIIFITTVPTSVLGPTDPGSNSRTSQSTSMTLTMESGTPFFTDQVTVSVSCRLTIMFELIEGTLTVREDGSVIGTVTFNFGSGSFIRTETESGSFTTSYGIITLELSYRYYDYLSGEDLGTFPMSISASQGEYDYENADEASWPQMYAQLQIGSFGLMILAAVLPTNILFRWRQDEEIDEPTVRTQESEEEEYDPFRGLH